MALGMRELFFVPYVIEKALDPPVVETLGQPFAAAFAQHVVLAWFALDRTVFGKLVQRVRPFMPVHKIEIRIPRVVGDCAPMLRVLHTVNDRAVAARRLAEAAAMFSRSQGPELAVNEWD